MPEVLQNIMLENTLVISPTGKVAKAKDFGLFILYPRVEMGSTIN